jgi:hypothetical protein
MHEYIEIQFKRRGKAFRLKRQTHEGFEFEEADAPTRTIDVGFRPFDEGTRERMKRICRVKGWPESEFRIWPATEEGSLVLRGDDEFSLPEGFYVVTTNVSDAKTKKTTPRRVEVPHDGHGLVVIELETDERTIDVDLDDLDPKMKAVLEASEIDGLPGLEWVASDDIRPTRRACALNLLASLRVTPTLSAPLIEHVSLFFLGKDDRTYARVSPSFLHTVAALGESHDKFFPEGRPHAPVHDLLIPAIDAFDLPARGLFKAADLLSFRAEGGPSLQMVIAQTRPPLDRCYVDFDLDLGNPLQDVAGFIVHIGELLDGNPTNHLDLRRKLRNGKAGQFIPYTVVGP